MLIRVLHKSAMISHDSSGSTVTPDTRVSSSWIPLSIEGLKKDAVPLLGFLGLVLVFFWPIIIGKAYLWGDFPERIYPFRLYAAVELQAGRFPFWNPYLVGGIPFLAMIDNAVLYPLNWIFILLVRNGALNFLIVEWHTIAHIFLSGVGTYYFCRSVGVSQMGAFTAGVTWMFSGPMVHHVFHGEMVHTVIWLPLILMLLVRALERFSFRLAVATGTLWGVAILAGHPQIFMYMAYTMGLYYLVCLIEPIRSCGRRREIMGLSGVFIIVMVVGLGLSAAVFLPANELATYSQRSDAGYDLVTTYALDLRQIVTFLMPDFFGRMDPMQWDYWGPGQEDYGHFWETYVYLGILPLLLAGAAVTIIRGHLTRFFGILALLSVLGILGETTPVFRAIYEIVPGFDRFRAHARLGMILGFAIAVLTGFGLDAIRRAATDDVSRKRLLQYFAVTGGIVFVGGAGYLLAADTFTDWLAGSVELREKAQAALIEHGSRSALMILLSFGVLAGGVWLRKVPMLPAIAAGGLILVDLFMAGMSFNRSTSGPDDYFPYNDLVRTLQQQQRLEGGRISYRAGSYGLLKRNAGSVYRITALEGLASPLRLADTTPPTTYDRMLDLMNVTYHIRMLDDGQTATFALNTDAMPRTFVVRNYIIAENMEAVSRAMADSTFNYRTTVTLDQRPTITINPDTAVAPEKPIITYYDPNRMDISVEMTGPGLLVISETYYPAWRAWVDGHEQRVYRADGTLRAIPLTEGVHTIGLHYESTTVRIGALISMLSLLVVIGTGVTTWRRKRTTMSSGNEETSEK